jgi:hypothetical protein
VLLTVAFENGFAVFHVDLPLLADGKGGYEVMPEPTQSTVVTATPMLSPIFVKRWQGRFDFSSVSWVRYGPHVDPCVAVLLHDAVSPAATVLLCAIHIPVHRRGLPSKEKVLSCQIIATLTVPKESSSFPSGLLQINRRILSYSKESISSIVISTSSLKRVSTAFLGLPVTSGLPGLSSNGDPYLTDSETDGDGILYVFATTNCERVLAVDGDKSMLGWSLPSRRLWLCRAVIGDTRETGMEDKKEDRGFGDSEEAMGGANSEVVCELDHESLSGMTPVRIVRCWGSKVCAVLFRSSLGSGADPSRTISLNTETLAMIDFEAGNVIDVVKGRDVAFFPRIGSEPVHGFILNAEGMALTHFTWSTSKSLDLTSSWRPILGVDNDVDYIDSLRASVHFEGAKLSLSVIGRRLRDNRTCVTVGDICDSTNTSPVESWKLLPNMVTSRSAWLDQDEEVLSLVGLQGDVSGYRNFALATSSRVLILSSGLTLSAEARKVVATSSLSPLGSFAVMFSTDRSVRYLCCLDDALSTGDVMTLRQASHGNVTSCLMAARPDRFLFCPAQCGVRLAELVKSSVGFQLPVPETRPAMLLEPMVANAVCLGGKQSSSTSVLRIVIEKFGRNVGSLAHGEREGIGPHGAGITARTFEILDRYGLKHPASWLLTGTVKFSRATSTKVLPPWLPIGPKSLAAQNTDAMLHIISQGDSYFSEYIKDPDHNAVSTLPRQSDAVAYLCREYANDAVRKGMPVDALKTLDICGAPSADGLALQLSLILAKKQGGKVQDILQLLGSVSEDGKPSASHSMHPSSSLAALALSMTKKSASRSKNLAMTDEQIKVWMRPLAPCMQKTKMSGRSRQRIFGEQELSIVARTESTDADSLWATSCNESKHIWYVVRIHRTCHIEGVD